MLGQFCVQGTMISSVGCVQGTMTSSHFTYWNYINIPHEFVIDLLSSNLKNISIYFPFKGLSELLDNLVTMEMLVYECHMDESLTFDDLQKMADYDKLELIMSKVMFV